MTFDVNLFLVFSPAQKRCTGSKASMKQNHWLVWPQPLSQSWFDVEFIEIASGSAARHPVKTTNAEGHCARSTSKQQIQRSKPLKESKLVHVRSEVTEEIFKSLRSSSRVWAFPSDSDSAHKADKNSMSHHKALKASSRLSHQFTTKALSLSPESIYGPWYTGIYM